LLKSGGNAVRACARAATAWLVLLASALVTASPGTAEVAWLGAAADADIERAFTQARVEHKPVLLYWGAKWCPPCNQLKATLFNRQDFIERSRSFVAVNIDGDQPGAQKLGARFKVRGYPTMILFNAAGAEITRLPGEVDAPQVLSLLQLGLSGGRPVSAVLADARAGKALSSNEWRMLAFYAWDTDEAQLVSEADRPALLAQLTVLCPSAQGDVAMRLLLRTLAESDDGKGIKPDAAMRKRVHSLLADARATRAQMDLLTNAAPEITRALAPDPGAQRQALVAAFDKALQRLQADTTLSRADRLSALMARVQLARLDQPKDTLVPKLPAALVQEVRDQAERADREITDGYERQAVISLLASMLSDCGLWKESDALLKANLARSHSAYYLMSHLGSNARKQGRKDEALRWYEQAFVGSVGPATRLQWGAGYLSALVDLSPQDVPRIERTASALIGEAAVQPDIFYERSARSLQRVGSKLATWNTGPERAAAMQRLQAQLAGVCSKLDSADAQRATCDALLKPALRKS
jgi:thioredoxin-related protein